METLVLLSQGEKNYRWDSPPKVQKGRTSVYYFIKLGHSLELSVIWVAMTAYEMLVMRLPQSTHHPECNVPSMLELLDKGYVMYLFSMVSFDGGRGTYGSFSGGCPCYQFTRTNCFVKIMCNQIVYTCELSFYLERPYRLCSIMGCIRK